MSAKIHANIMRNGCFRAELTSGSATVEIIEKVRRTGPETWESDVQVGWWSGGGDVAEMIDLLVWANEIKAGIEGMNCETIRCKGGHNGKD